MGRNRIEGRGKWSACQTFISFYLSTKVLPNLTGNEIYFFDIISLFRNFLDDFVELLIVRKIPFQHLSEISQGDHSSLKNNLFQCIESVSDCCNTDRLNSWDIIMGPPRGHIHPPQYAVIDHDARIGQWKTFFMHRCQRMGQDYQLLEGIFDLAAICCPNALNCFELEVIPCLKTYLLIPQTVMALI